MLGFFTEEIPKTCIECRHAICNRKGDSCNLTGESIETAIEDDIRSTDCPIRKVPSLRSPHSPNMRRTFFYKGFNEAVKVIAQGKRRQKKEEPEEKKDNELDQVTLEQILEEMKGEK